MTNLHALPPSKNDDLAKQAGAEAIPDRTVPVNLEVEAALIGAVLRQNRVYDVIGSLVTKEDFYSPAHQRIFALITRTITSGQVASLTTLRHVMQSDEQLREIDATSYIARILETMTSFFDAPQYSRIVRDLATKRRLIGIGEEIVSQAYNVADLDMRASDLIEQAEAQLFALASTGDDERKSVSVLDASLQAVTAAGKAYFSDGSIVGVTTGFRDLNEMLGGLHPSDLLIVAGRPAMGKTAFGTALAFNAAKEFEPETTSPADPPKKGARVLFFSLEMAADQLGARIISQVAGIPSHRMRSGRITKDELHKLTKAANDLSNLQLYIDDTPSLSVQGLRTKARRQKRTYGLDLIIVDYLQLLQTSGKRSHENRVQEVSEITRTLKSIARELNVPLIALSQLSRQVESRDDKRPQLSDLRESGSIEQDADVVSFLFRREYYLEKEVPVLRSGESDESFEKRHTHHHELLEESRNIAQIIIAKQRHGPTGVVDLLYEADLTRFSDLDRIHDTAPPQKQLRPKYDG
ncbi:MAG: replicative DNA helicase [Pseudomonadota bacterium]